MLTQPEKEYVKRLLQAQPSLTNEDLDTLIEKRREKEATMKIPKQKGILGKALDIGASFGAGTIQGGGELAVGLPGQLSRLLPGDQSADPNSFYSKTRKVLDYSKSTFEPYANTEGASFGAGKGLVNIMGGSVGAGLVGKGVGILSKTAPAMNLGTRIATSAPRTAKYGSSLLQGLTGQSVTGNIGQKVLGGAATGAREGLGYDLASGKTPGAGTVGGAVVGGALPIVGAGLKATGNYLSRTLPGNLQLQGLMNPAKVTMLKKQLQTEGVTSPQDVGKWMLDRGIKGNKETIISTLISRAEKSKQAVDDSLSAIKKTVFSPVAKKALQQTYDDMAKVAGLEDDAAKVLKLLNKDKYTLSELNGVKRILDDQYNLFTKTGDPTAGLKAKGLQTIRQQLRKTIEEVASEAGVKNIRALNNETQIARTMADAIARKDSADAVREALTAFAPTGVGGIIGGVAGPFDNSTIEGKVGNVLLGMLAGKVLGSTTLKTNVASLLNKLSKQEISALDAYIKSGGKGNLPSQIVEKMEAMKLLPPPSGMPVSGNVVDVKPMTGFSPGVLQKQSQAISSKVGTQPLTTQQSLQSGATSLLGNKIGLESGKKVSPLKKLKTNADIIGKKTVNAKTPQTKPLSQKSEGKTEPTRITIKDGAEWTPDSKIAQDIFYVDRNGIRQTEFESTGKNVKGQRAGYTMEEYLKKNGLSKDDFTLNKGTDGADGLYTLNEKGLSKLEKLRVGTKPKPSLPLSQKSEVKYSKPDTPGFNREKPYGLTTEEGDLISKYTNWGYKGKDGIKELDKAIEKIPNSPGITFRGDNLNDFSKFEKGKIVSFDKPLSSSYKSDIADNFKGNTVFTIDGITGKDIDMLSDVSGEGEVLFSSKSKFKVKSVYKSKDGITNIELSQIE